MYDKKFYKLLDYVFADEGGFSNNANDRGGRTNFGVTQIALNEYRKKYKLPFKDVASITKSEAEKIYYEDYYLKSGADKQKDIRDSYILFDTAVNFHPITAKKMFKQSNENFYNMLDIRRKKHLEEVKNNPGQKEFIDGWLKRVNRIEKRADELIKDPDYKPSYTKDITPFDSNYNGNLKKIKGLNNAEQKESLKNKYQYLLNKNQENTLPFSEDKRTSGQKFSDKIRSDYQKAKNRKLQKIFGKSESGNSAKGGSGSWVTIRGHHVYLG